MRLTKTTNAKLHDAEALTSVKEHLRVGGDFADGELDRMLNRSVADVMARTNRELITNTYELRFDAFPRSGCLELPRAPLSSIGSIQYDDADDVQQTWAVTEYEMLADREPGLVRLAKDKQLPPQASAWIVTFNAGYGTTWDALPELVRDALLELTHYRYFNRDGSPLPEHLQTLIWQIDYGDEFTQYVTS